jgi:diaminopimelate decarboxylase
VVDGFDVSSLAEFKLLNVSAKIDSSRLTISGPSKSDSFLSSLFRRDLHCLHLDSREEYETFRSFKRKSVRVCNEESFSQKVGIPDADLNEIVESAGVEEFIGFHIYIGREQFSLDKFKWALTKMQRFYMLNPKAFVAEVEVFFGAGLSGYENLDPFEFKKLIPVNWKIHLEAGRALVQSAGVYAARVLSVKENRIIIDGGLQHMATHLSSPRTGLANVSTLCFRGKNLIECELSRFIICGSLSLWNDVLVSELELPKEIRRNDWILFHPAGSYGWTAGSSQFIGPSECDEFIFSDGNMKPASPEFLKSYLESF